MKTILLSVCWLLTGALAAYGQLVQSARAELLIPATFSAFQVWPQPDSTVLVLDSEPYYRRNLEPYTLLRFNQDLYLRWRIALSVSRGSSFLQAGFEKKLSYFLFQGSKAGELELVMVNNVTGKQYFSKHALPENMTFTLANLSVMNGYLFLTGHQNDRLVLLQLNPDLPELRILPALFEQTATLTEFLTDTISKRVEFVLAESNGRRARLQVKRLAPDGRLLSLNFINLPDRNFLASRLAPGDSTAKLMLGSYSLRDLRYAQGFFTGMLNTDPRKQFNFFDFTNFTHYFDYLRPGRQLRLRQRIARLKMAQKVFHLRQRILLHAPQPYQNGYLLTGELYYPHYSGEASNRTFDGYEHTSAIVAAFDKAGNLKWENSFPLHNQRFYDLKETVAVTTFGENVLLAFADDNKINYKLLQNNQTTPNDQFLELKSPKEKVVYTEPEGVQTWYQNHVLAFGTQEIRGMAGLRTVFYISKLSAQK